MTTSRKSHQHSPHPSDVPSGRSPALAPLHVLVGTWFVEMTHVALSAPVHGLKTYTWLEGGHFLIERTRFDHPDVPDSVAVIGADASGEGLSEHYFDSRGVLRVFKMTLENGLWKAWRDESGFSQRFTGTFSADVQTLEVVGELSQDGMQWEHDFTHRYSKGKGAS